MFELKPISRRAIAKALAKAERYRLLNEPSQAESICRDILAVDAGNQEAVVMLLLALTDQFEHGSADVTEARRLVPSLQQEYDRFYYTGIIFERRGTAIFRGNGPGAGAVVYEWIRQAMDCYERAEALRPPENDDAILRWNTCARFLMRYPELAPQEREDVPLLLE